VERAAAHADEVQFSAEDAARSELEFLAEACRRAIDAGATVVNLPDTVGYTMPAEYAQMIRDLRELCPLLRQVDVSVHCHDDLGFAVANSLAGVAAGASQIECTINGIGERAGNAALEEVVMALRVRADFYGARTNVDPSGIYPASALVARITDYAVQPNKAIVGANAFAHEAGIHQDGLLKDLATYQIIDPAELGLAMTLPLGKHSGRHAFARACAEAGLEFERDELNAAFRRFKELADQGGTVTLDDVLEEARR
jgi:2-isopropylmalate synthase